MFDDFVSSNSTISRDVPMYQQRYSHIFVSKYWSFPCYLYKFCPFRRWLIITQNFNFAQIYFIKKFLKVTGLLVTEQWSDVYKCSLDCNTEESCRQIISRNYFPRGGYLYLLFFCVFNPNPKSLLLILLSKLFAKFIGNDVKVHSGS